LFIKIKGLNLIRRKTKKTVMANKKVTKPKVEPKVEVEKVKKGFVLSQASLNNMSGINEFFITLAKKVILETPVDFGIIKNGGFRTSGMQGMLYMAGVSKCDGQNTISRHQTGNAVDFIPYVNGKFTWEDEEAFIKLHETVMKIWSEMKIQHLDLIWGGDWKNFHDPSHYELRKKA